MPRSAPAAREGVRAALAFPIESRGEVLGVIEFFSAEAREPDDDLVDLLSGIGSQVGQFVLRREAEREVRASEARKCGDRERRPRLHRQPRRRRAASPSSTRPPRPPSAAPATTRSACRVTDLLIPERLRGEHAAAFERYLAGG